MACQQVWMGTHPNGPASLYSDPQTSLKSLISTDPAYFIGAKIASRFPVTSLKERASRHPEIPFLFKVLSIAKALPLQAHPDKTLAEKLNVTDGESFVDANHKPEIALALGDFRGFVGFKPLKDIRRAIDKTPELREVLGKDIHATDNELLKKVVSALLLRPQSETEPVVRRLVQRLKTQDKSDPLSLLIQEVDAQYPGDVGVLFAPFLMNLVTLAKGEGVYIGADTPHAYLSGDIIECMAVSDNVVNAAFVPPDLRDAHTFINMLTYSPQNATSFTLPENPYNGSVAGKTTAYDPPLEEFTVLRTKLENQEEEELEKVRGPTIGIVLEGEIFVSVEGDEEVFKPGAVCFVPAEKKIQLRNTTREPVEVFWAAVVA